MKQSFTTLDETSTGRICRVPTDKSLGIRGLSNRLNKFYIFEIFCVIGKFPFNFNFFQWISCTLQYGYPLVNDWVSSALTQQWLLILRFIHWGQLNKLLKMLIRYLVNSCFEIPICGNGLCSPTASTLVGSKRYKLRISKLNEKPKRVTSIQYFRKQCAQNNFVQSNFCIC